MDRKEWTLVDKSKWGEGPWQDEHDKEQWQDPATGLPCLIVRGPLGGLCGYVGVAEGHRYFGVNYNDVPVDVHGGLTFSDKCQGQPEGHTICHLPAEGEPDEAWWLGFDCGHVGDLLPNWHYIPGFLNLSATGDGIYRDLEYVRAEVTRLAAQLV